MLTSPISFWVGFKAGSCNDSPFWLIVACLVSFNEHIACKHALKREFRNSANLYHISRVGANSAIAYVNPFIVQVIYYLIVQSVKLIRGKGYVNISPPNS